MITMPLLSDSQFKTMQESCECSGSDVLHIDP